MRFALVLSGLLLVACHNQSTMTLQSRNLPAQGIDLPTDASDALNDIRDSKLDFVARYYRSPTSRWPTLTAAEAQRLSSLGVKIIAVWSGILTIRHISHMRPATPTRSAPTPRQKQSVNPPAAPFILRWTTTRRAATSAARSTSISAG